MRKKKLFHKWKCKNLKNWKQAQKMSSKNLKDRNGTDNELEEFSKIFADDENAFAVSLEKLVLKKSANSEVFSQMKIAFCRALRDPDVKKKNDELHFQQKMVKS